MLRRLATLPLSSPGLGAASALPSASPDDPDFIPNDTLSAVSASSVLHRPTPALPPHPRPAAHLAASPRPLPQTRLQVPAASEYGATDSVGDPAASGPALAISHARVGPALDGPPEWQTDYLSHLLGQIRVAASVTSVIALGSIAVALLTMATIDPVSCISAILSALDYFVIGLLLFDLRRKLIPIAHAKMFPDHLARDGLSEPDAAALFQLLTRFFIHLTIAVVAVRLMRFCAILL